MSYRSTKRFHLLAAGLLLSAAPALGQGLPIDLMLPPATVIGRPSTIGAGQATAIPFAQLAAQLSQNGLLSNPLTFAQFPAIGANTVIGSIAGGAPSALSSAQITAMINLTTSSLPGALPAWPNNTTTFFRGDGTYVTLNAAALGGLGTGVATALGVNVGTAGAPIVNGGALGTPSSGTVGTSMTLGGVTLGLGSDATGDVYYNNGGVLTRLPKGTNGQVLELVSGLPAWASAAGTGTVTQIVAGSAAVTGTCTTSCAVVSQTAPTTWTPADGSGSSLVFANVSASYTQIGNMVFAYASLAYPTTASGAPAALSGFPVTAANHPYAVQCNVSYTSGLAGVKIAMIAGQTNALLYTPAGAAATNAQMTAGTINFMCIYPAT
jgi:hypothetical protein